MQFSAVPTIPYEGPDSKNPLSFRYYNPDEYIGTKPMKEHLRFSIAFWHTCTGLGTDPFGLPTMQRPWDTITDPMKKAEARVLAIFEIAEKLQVPFFCFHDRDIAPEAHTLTETNIRLDTITTLLKKRMADSPLSLLWGTANLFSHPRYMHGAATSPHPQVFAYAAAQVKKALEITKELSGANYVFWGGREGYETLLNTHMKLEIDNFARFLHMAIAYAKEIGFGGQMLFEPKPKEPTKHQYDFDVGTIIGFLRSYDLFDNVKINIEANHATLAGHTMQHELHLARINGILGSVDANQGDMLLGWDTDQFPTDVYKAMFVMYEILKNDGIAPGGINFDAKLRRSSHTIEDIFYGHIAGIDTFARGLRIAHSLLESKALEQYIEQRYAGYNTGIGKEITDNTTSFSKLEQYTVAHENETIEIASGRQELLETIVNQYIR